MNLHDEFIEYMRENLSAPVYKTHHAAFRKMTEYFQSSGKTITDEWKKEDYIALFNACGCYQKRRFTVFKTALGRYLDFLIEHGVLSSDAKGIVKEIRFETLSLMETRDTTAQEREVYFRNLPHFTAAIEDVISHTDVEDNTVFDVQISILYLLWYGATFEQIHNIKKTDLQDNVVMVDGREIELCNEAAEAMNRYKYADGFYYSVSGGRAFVTYKPSVYLFRSRRNDHMPAKTLIDYVSKFNLLMPDKYDFKPRSIYRSACYHAAFVEECIKGTVDFKTCSDEVFQQYFPYSGNYKRRHVYDSYVRYKEILYTSNG